MSQGLFYDNKGLPVKGEGQIVVSFGHSEARGSSIPLFFMLYFVAQDRGTRGLGVAAIHRAVASVFLCLPLTPVVLLFRPQRPIPIRLHVPEARAVGKLDDDRTTDGANLILYHILPTSAV